MLNNIKEISGILEVKSSGKGYVVSDKLEEDIFISKLKLNKAFNGDEVIAYVYKRRNKLGKIEGEIRRILKRKNKRFIGVLQSNNNFGFVNTRGRRMYTDFYIEKSQLKKYKNNDKVVVEYIDWPKKSENPNGKIIKSLGKYGNIGTELNAIINEYEIDEKFNKKVLEELKILGQTTKIKRKDFRNKLTFTIDPKDAKDFDDAISLEKIGKNLYEVGIHIADVTHFVKKGSLIDEEARKRATSVYLVDRVIPMLPEKISNELCSLRPKEDKYTFSAVYNMDNKGNIKKQWYGKTIINSNNRLTYEEAQKIIENKKEKGKLEKAIKILNIIAKEKREKRTEQGAIIFNKEEVKFELNKEKEPKKIFFKKQKEANKLIEEFMLLANKKVAEYVDSIISNKNFIYRVHDKPDEEKIKNLKEIIKRLGYEFKKEKNINGKEINRILKKAEGKKEKIIIESLVLRAMSKAEYTNNNIGHYGLAFKKYTHFTSPIRRYPDIVVHRILNNILNKEKGEENILKICKNSTSQEIRATQAERESIKMMQIKYMENKIGEKYYGTISGINERAIYVEINENKCEGRVRVNEIKNQKYWYNEKTHKLIEKRKGIEIQLGDKVKIKVKKADIYNRIMDFELLEVM